QKLMILLLLRYTSILQSTLTVQLCRQGTAFYIEVHSLWMTKKK
uniref:Uncharacterized protein n=1 Tax=Aegilops tauschii subsp. strangulata TaxID=200361 RepID=A0A453I360_AEGTS